MEWGLWHCCRRHLPPPAAAELVARSATLRCCPAQLQVADLPSLKQRLAELEQAAAAEDLWEQRSRAQAVLQQLNQLREEVAQLERFSGQLDDLGVAVELLEMEVGISGAERGCWGLLGSRCWCRFDWRCPHACPHICLLLRRRRRRWRQKRRAFAMR